HPSIHPSLHPSLHPSSLPLSVPPSQAAARADAPGSAARPRLLHRHRARGALARPRLQRHLQPLLLQLPPPDPPEPRHLLPDRRGEERGGENPLPAVRAAGARLLLAPVPAAAAPLPGERGAAAARPGHA
ncbi:hypothetical protein Nmel_005018, partial [Mimus melanotis]